MKKRILAAALAALFSAALCGCSDSKDSGGTGLDDTVSAPEVHSSADTESQPEISSEPADVPAESEPPESETQPEPTEETAEPEETVNYADLITAFSNSYLGLPSDDRVYVFSDAGKTELIDDLICHAVSCYDEFEGTLYYMCDFYISEDGSCVYRLYENEERFQLLPEEQGYVRLDPTTQPADEIFEKVKELEMIFTPYARSAVITDPESAIEIDGQQFDLVTDERLNTKQKLLETLDKYISMEIVGAMMDTGAVAEKDGNIYVRHSDGMGGNPDLQSVEYELTVLTGDEAVFTEYDTYLYEAGETEVKEITYKAEKQYGMWRFTEYPMTNLWQ